MDALGGVMDAQGLIDSVQQDLAQGRGVGEALTRGVTTAWSGNAIGDAMGQGGGGVQNVSTTLLGSAMLPNGVNNILPDQFAANTMSTGLDAWSGIVEDGARSLGGGELSTAGMERFADGLAARPGADPFAGYARLGELVSEELGDADMSVMDMARNLGEDLQRMDEQDVFVEQALESASSFEQEVFEGQHGTVLRGLSQATRAATDPPTPSQFAEDATNIGRAMYEEVTGSGGAEGGMGPGFWEEIAEHNNETVRGIPVVGTVFDGYAQVASGIEEGGVGGFSTEMYEGAAALADEGAMMASEQASAAYEAASQQASAAYDAVARWF
jgi:hypothetical protein